MRSITLPALAVALVAGVRTGGADETLPLPRSPGVTPVERPSLAATRTFTIDGVTVAGGTYRARLQVVAGLTPTFPLLEGDADRLGRQGLTATVEGDSVRLAWTTGRRGVVGALGGERVETTSWRAVYDLAAGRGSVTRDGAPFATERLARIQGTIHGRVRVRRGDHLAPVAVPVLVWRHGGSWMRTVSSRADGTFELDTPAATFNLTANKADQIGRVTWLGARDRENVAVAAGERVLVELELEDVAPRAVLRPAPRIELPKVDTDPDRNADSNSPAHWVGDTLHVFESAFAAYRSTGSSQGELGGTRAIEFDNPFGLSGGRWIEATYRAETSDRLYGWYHHEPTFEGTHLTAPKIGAAWSDDEGATWHDLGVVLDAPAGTIDHGARNGYFMGGHGDFSVIRQGDHFYFLFTSYSGPTASQGVALARMPLTKLNDPVGAVVKWHEGAWSEPGRGGAVTPIFPATRSWAESDPTSFWGPSVHWNSHLESFVVLMNRTEGGAGDWRQEGVYATFNADLAQPDRWTTPSRVVAGGSWYPQVMGTDRERRETDKLAGRTARFYAGGRSEHEIEFRRAGEDD